MVKLPNLKDVRFIKNATQGFCAIVACSTAVLICLIESNRPLSLRIFAVIGVILLGALTMFVIQTASKQYKAWMAIIIFVVCVVFFTAFCFGVCLLLFSATNSTGKLTEIKLATNAFMQTAGDVVASPRALSTNSMHSGVTKSAKGLNLNGKESSIPRNTSSSETAETNADIIFAKVEFTCSRIDAARESRIIELLTKHTLGVTVILQTNAGQIIPAPMIIYNIYGGREPSKCGNAIQSLLENDSLLDLKFGILPMAASNGSESGAELERLTHTSTNAPIIRVFAP